MGQRSLRSFTVNDIRQVQRFARSFLRNPQDAEDVAQEALLRAHRFRNQYDPTRASFRTWLQTLTKNAAMYFQRRQIRQARVRILNPRTVFTPEALAAAREDLRNTVNRMEPREHRAFRLFLSGTDPLASSVKPMRRQTVYKLICLFRQRARQAS